MQISPEYWFLASLLVGAGGAFITLRKQTATGVVADVHGLQRRVKDQQGQIDFLLGKITEMQLEMATLRAQLRTQERENAELNDRVAIYKTKFAALGLSEK